MLFISFFVAVLKASLLHPAGLSKDKDEDGFHTYRRPEGKSGGHGVGWSEIPVYTFKVRL